MNVRSAVPCSLSVVFVLCFTGSRAQVTDRVYTKTSWEQPQVRSESTYVLTPAWNVMAIPTLFHYERFDSLGRMVEIKRFDKDYTLHEWSLRSFNDQGLVEEIRYLQEDSTLTSTTYLTYDDRGRRVRSIALDPAGDTIWIYTDTYFPDRTVFTARRFEERAVSVYTDHLDKLGRVRSTDRVMRVGGTERKEADIHYDYADTVCIHKLTTTYAPNGRSTGEEEWYDKAGRPLRSERIDTAGRHWPTTEMRYDKHGGLTYEKRSSRGKTVSVKRWERSYDQSDREVHATEWCDTLQFSPVRHPRASELFSSYPVDEDGVRMEIRRTIEYDIHGDGTMASEAVSTKRLGEWGEWISTTQTINGELAAYWFVVREYQ